ncbi:MAG: SPFH domain-containing protein [Candidatus Paceibacterota bacterium]|jgi:regulator of protease activity HflC (stomatin/prohibitin superfamily)
MNGVTNAGKFNEKTQKEWKNKMFWTFLIANLATIIAAGIAIVIDPRNELNAGYIIIAVQLLYAALSIKIVGPTELGGILLFGDPRCEVESGLVLVPFAICELKKETRLVIQRQFPGEPEEVDKSSTDQNTRSGMVQPIRVPTASPEAVDNEFKADMTAFKDEPINNRMTPEVSIIVRFQIRKGSYLRFLTNIGTLDSAIKQMRDTTETVTGIEFAKRTPPLIIRDRGKINNSLKDSVEILVGEKPNSEPEESWGVNVINVQLVDVDFGKTVNEQLRNVIAKKLEKQQTITTAEGARQARELEGAGEKSYLTDKGLGDAAAREALLKAEAAGIDALRKVTGTKAGQLALHLKVIQTALQSANYSIIPGSELYSSIGGIMEMAKKVGISTPNTPKGN